VQVPNRAALATPMQQICNGSITTTFACGDMQQVYHLLQATLFFCAAGVTPAASHCNLRLQNKIKVNSSDTTPQQVVVYHHQVVVYHHQSTTMMQ